MTSWQNAIILGAGVVREYINGAVTMTLAVANVAVWPGTFTGRRAEAVLLQPGSDVHFAVDKVAATAGLNAGLLKGGSEYFFPLHPTVNTLSFLSATGTSNQLRINWVVQR